MKSSFLLDDKSKLTKSIMSWYSDNYRELPWRETRDPYVIWLSEIILQQTRISQGLPYFEKFLHQYPTVHDLATASEDEVLKLWQGLGYYSRARNLHSTAKKISGDLEGKFPGNYHELLSLKGVGKYTAAAIASICFDERVPAVDGNAFRFISRLLNISDNIASSPAFKIFFEATQQIMPEKNCGQFNQAVMDLGAMICLPTSPKCDICPVRLYCRARKENLIDRLPVKEKKLEITERTLIYHIIKYGEKLLIRQRTGRGIWQGLFEFLLIEKTTSSSDSFNKLNEIIGEKPVYEGDKMEHRLTHQKLNIYFKVYEVDDSDFERIKKNYQMQSILVSEIDNFGVPKPIERFLKSADLLLNSNFN